MAYQYDRTRASNFPKATDVVPRFLHSAITVDSRLCWFLSGSWDQAPHWAQKETELKVKVNGN